MRFGRGGAEYEIDLNREYAWAFRKQLAPFVERSRKAGPGAGADGTKPSAQRRHPGLGERQGYRGRRPRAHPRHVVEQYQPPPKDPDAHPITAGMNQAAQPAQIASVPSQGAGGSSGFASGGHLRTDTYGW